VKLKHPQARVQAGGTKQKGIHEVEVLKHTIRRLEAGSGHECLKLDVEVEVGGGSIKRKLK
jgi:hypothetical protein